MSKISDVIEEFILNQMIDGEVSISRNELANFFNCAPSQINYVLSTRFTNPRGFVIESRRGGGGYIRLTKIDLNKDDYIENLVTHSIGDEIGEVESRLVVNEMRERGIINDSELNIITSALSNRALANPIKIENKLRANILRNILINIIKGD